MSADQWLLHLGEWRYWPLGRRGEVAFFLFKVFFFFFFFQHLFVSCWVKQLMLMVMILIKLLDLFRILLLLLLIIFTGLLSCMCLSCMVMVRHLAHLGDLSSGAYHQSLQLCPGVLEWMLLKIGRMNFKYLYWGEDWGFMNRFGGSLLSDKQMSCIWDTPAVGKGWPSPIQEIFCFFWHVPFWSFRHH